MDIKNFKIKKSKTDILYIGHEKNLNLSLRFYIKNLSDIKWKNEFSNEEKEEIQKFKNQILEKKEIPSIAISYQNEVLEYDTIVEALKQLNFEKIPTVQLTGLKDFLNKDSLKEICDNKESIVEEFEFKLSTLFLKYRWKEKVKNYITAKLAGEEKWLKINNLL